MILIIFKLKEVCLREDVCDVRKNLIVFSRHSCCFSLWKEVIDWKEQRESDRISRVLELHAREIRKVL